MLWHVVITATMHGTVRKSEEENSIVADAEKTHTAMPHVPSYEAQVLQDFNINTTTTPHHAQMTTTQCPQ